MIRLVADLHHRNRDRRQSLRFWHPQGHPGAVRTSFKTSIPYQDRRYVVVMTETRNWQVNDEAAGSNPILLSVQVTRTEPAAHGPLTHSRTVLDLKATAGM